MQKPLLSWYSTLVSLICIHLSDGVPERAQRTSLFTSALDSYDAVLNHTFGSKEFGSPWGAAALVNSSIGLSFGFFTATGSELKDARYTGFNPWEEHQKDSSLHLEEALLQAMRVAANGSAIASFAVFIHGFCDGGKGQPQVDGNVTHGAWSSVAAASYATLSPGKHLAIAVDWEQGASGITHYSRAMSTTRVVGLYVQKLIAAARRTFGANVTAWCVGHSLGAHSCGLAGKYSKAFGDVGWDVISALDPAGPSVTATRLAATSWVEPAFAQARLAPGDAKFTEVLHTDWGGLGFHGVLAACIDKHHRYDTWNFKHCSRSRVQLGHLESYANPLNYTASGSLYPSWLPDQAFVQPGCSHLHLMCSHQYAKRLLLFHLTSRRQFFLKSDCGTPDRSQKVLNLCPIGQRVAPVGILEGSSETPHAQVEAYNFDGHQAPDVQHLTALFPDDGPAHLEQPLLRDSARHSDSARNSDSVLSPPDMSVII